MKHHRNTIYSRYTSDGQLNPLWKWSSTSMMLAAFLQDETQAKADRDYAATILSWCVEREKSGVGTFFDDLFANCLFEHPEHWSLRDVTSVNGVTTRECVCDEARLRADCPPSESRYDKPKVMSTAPVVDDPAEEI